ncbi:MAG TPA: ABC transporter substrate-binding protein [Deltaproteobacteria bacterium]|nr:ABC transporter substrate-binding protein [Deltaproteobacteria bacterium]HOM28622.1 ABC transporter substrate-binding protein [Deltaproteobacteria bacterium]HPP79885.1 ABC transporter substrate-binding protein [Deltaproteobacteria bacterium]
MKRVFRHTLKGVVVFGLSVLLVLSAGQASKAAGPKEIKIGNILPLSGPSASVGLQNKQAVELATEKINAAGGIKSLGGAKLVNVFTDSKGDPNVGVTAAEQLINTEKVVLISGAWNSAVTYPSTQVAERYQVPYVVPVSVADKITERGFKYTFRIAAKDSWWTDYQFKFLEEQKKLTGTKIETMAFVYENGDWGTGMAKQWHERAKKFGYKVVLDEAYPSTASDLTPVVMKIKTKKPDVILLTSNAADAILLTNTMATMKVKAKAIIGTGGGHADPAFRKNTGKNCEYMFDVVEWETDLGRPQIPALNAEFKKRYGYDLAGESVDAFASVYVIADALERAKSTDPKKIRDALAATKLCVGQGKLGIDILSYDCIEFDKTGQNKHAGIVLVQFRDVKGTMERVTVFPTKVARPGFKAVFPMP